MGKRARRITMTIDRELLKEQLARFVSETLPSDHVMESFTVHRSGQGEIVVKVGDGEEEQPMLPDTEQEGR